MVAPPLVSVIIPIYNGMQDLPDLLAGLRAQTYPIDRVEYLLVDNNSQDGTYEHLVAAAAQAQEQGWPLRILREPEIQSSYAARNTGIRAARGEILAFTDADCRPAPHWLTDLVAPFWQDSSSSKLGLVIGEIKALPGHSLWERYADRQDTLSQKHTLAHPFCPYGQTANVAIRREVLRSTGLFRPYLTTGGDADLCWRILRTRDWQWHFAETAIVYHRHRQTLKELRSQWRRYGRSNRFLHDLHGIDLMRQPRLQDYAYRLLRWLLKELPTAIVKRAIGRAELVDLLNTPIHLICLQARWQGQSQAKLPAAAREIAPWHP